MSTIVTRSGKGSPLSNTEVDANFTNLNTDKLEKSGGTMTGNVSFGQNNKVILNSALEIYNDGSNNYLKSLNAGWLNIPLTGNGVSIADSDFSENIAKFVRDGACELYYDGTKRFETNSSGITVTGSGRFDNSASTSVRLHINNSGSNDYASIYADTASAYKNVVINPSGGMVGIGTTSPDYLLEVEKANSDHISTSLALTNIQNGGYGSSLNFVSKRTDAANVVAARIRTQGADSWNSDASTDSNLFFSTVTANTLTDWMMIQHDGNVGIGENAPLSLLSLASTSGEADIRLHREDTAIVNNDSYGNIFWSGDDSDSNANGIRGFIRGKAQGTGGGMKMEFGTAAGGTAMGSDPRMTIDADGNVGIGTTSLDISGNGSNYVGLSIIKTSGTRSAFIELGDNQNADTGNIGDINFVGHYQDAGHKVMGSIGALAAGSTSGQRGSALRFSTKANASTTLSERMRITSTSVDITGVLQTNPGTLTSNTSGTNQHITVDWDGSPRYGYRYDSGVRLALDSYNAGAWFEVLKIDLDNGRLLLGTTTEGIADGDNFTISGSGNTGMTIRSTDSNRSTIYFSDATSGTGEYAGYILYDHSNSKFSLGVNTDTALTVDISRNIGIGVSSPAAKVDIRPANEAANTFRVYRGISGGYELDYLNISQYAGDTVFNSYSNNAANSEFIFQQNGTEALRIGLLGSLQLNNGTTDYSAANAGVTKNYVQLTTDYDAAGSQSMTFSRLDGNWTDGTSGGDTSSGWLWNFQDKVRAGMIYDFRDTERFRIWSSYGDMAFMTSGQDVDSVPTDNNCHERMIVTQAGNVGIGTSVPAGILSLGKGTRTLDFKLETTPATGDMGVQLRGSSGDFIGIAADSGTGLVVDSSNKVGIGATAPSDYDAEADNLVVKSGGHTGITVVAAANSRSNLYFADGTSGSEKYVGGITYDHNSSGGDYMLFRAGGEERLRLDYNLDIKNGNLLVADGHGVYFGAVSGGSSTSEMLADYEEGTFTPSVGSASGSGGAASNATGNYTKIGNRVFADLHFSVNTVGSMSGVFFVTGFPYPANASNVLAQGAVRSQGIGGSNDIAVSFEMVAGESYGRFHFMSSSSTQRIVQVSDISAGDFMALSIGYII